MTPNPENLYQDVEFLTTLDPPRNYRHIQSLGRAAEYIRNVFAEHQLQTATQSWKAAGQTYENIIGSYRPELPERLIVGAHYDVWGDNPGADDNASAVAGLLETARLIGQNQPDTDYRIDFVAYCLEEPPFFGTEFMGSYVHANALFRQQASVLGMICFEMIGYFSEEPHSQGFPDPVLAQRYPTTGNFIIVVGIESQAAFSTQVYELMKTKSEVDIQIIHLPDQHPLAAMSDQLNYWHFGYPALMINDTSFLRNPHYHQPTDTIETLDFTSMKEVVSGAYHAIINIR